MSKEILTSVSRRYHHYQSSIGPSGYRFDAGHAVGTSIGFDPIFASDGIDELLAGFAPRRTEFPISVPASVLVRAEDTDDQWHVTLAPDGITTVGSEGPADVILAGDASDLYLNVWNRTGDSSITITGDREVLARWHNNMRVRWS